MWERCVFTYSGVCTGSLRWLFTPHGVGEDTALLSELCIWAGVKKGCSQNVKII